MDKTVQTSDALARSPYITQAASPALASSGLALPELASQEQAALEPAQYEHARRVQSLFSRIARIYDPLNSLFSLGFDAFWRARLADCAAPLCPAPHGGAGRAFDLTHDRTGRILDLAAGTMEVTMELARRYPDATILAMDFCPTMLARGLPKLTRLKKKRAKAGHPVGEKTYGSVLPLVGDVRHLPLATASMDTITLAFGLRNIMPRSEVYAEALRVLAPGGRLCVLEFSSARDRILFGFYNLYLHYVLPLVGRMVLRDKKIYRYLAETIESFPSAVEMEEEMRRAGFVAVRHTRHTFGIVGIHIAEAPV